MRSSCLGFAVIVVVALALGGCKSKETGARETFARQYTCPEDRVEVRERADVRPSTTQPAATPPAEVKSDPGRLKMWQDEQDKRAKNADDACDMFEARGCGEQTLLCCMRPPKHVDRVNCSTRPYGSAAKW